MSIHSSSKSAKFAFPLRFFARCALLLTPLLGCSDESSKKEAAATSASAAPKQPPLPVTVLTVQTQKHPSIIEVVGQTEGSKEIEVRSRVSGWIKKQLYREGSFVKSGQALFQLDRAPFEITLAQSQAALREAQARLTQAKRESVRLQGLITQQAVSQKEVDDAKTNYQIAMAVEQRAQANLREARLNFSYTTITAPAGGLSGRATRTEGNLVGTGAADSLMTTIVQINPMRARFSLSENDLTRLGIQQLTPAGLSKMEMLLPDGTIYPLPGKLDFLANQIDPTLGTRSLRALFDNPKGSILPGQFVRLRIFTTHEQESVAIPQVAVSQTDKGLTVFVVDQHNVITPRPIKTGEWSGSEWMVTAGLQNGERVVVDQIMKLKPGMAVAPREASTTTPSTTATSTTDTPKAVTPLPAAH